MKLLSSKIFAGYLLVIVLLTSLILYFSFKTIDNQYLDTITENLKNINNALHPQILYYLNTTTTDELDSHIKKIGKSINTRITIIDANGKVLADSRKDPRAMENHKQRPELVPIFQGRQFGQSLRFSTTVHDKMIYVALPIIGEKSKFLGAIRVSIFYSEVNKLTNRLTYEIIQIALIVVVLSLLGVLLFSRSITKPINQISRLSRQVASGDFDAKIYLTGRDEISDLAANFNNMTERLKELFSEVLRQKDELNILIKTIQEGLVAIDTTGSVLLANKGFCEILGKNNIIGKNIHLLFDTPEVLDIYQNILNQKSSFTKEVEINKKIFLCSANFIETKKEVVLLFHDITEIKKLENIKKDFITNVSHELRTPLTAIKGFIETLDEEITLPEHSHYIDIVKRHTNRLISIVQDLLSLSELEDPNLRLLTAPVDLKFLVENVVKIFEQKLSEKGIILSIEISPNFPKLEIDAFKFEQVFVNLIDNAIKYSEAGNIKIIIHNDQECSYISIQDSGRGISKEDQQRIFERFYIADKSRSRKVGGTGLGLSIVKHIVQLHKGEISVSSLAGEGTVFTIKLPL